MSAGGAVDAVRSVAIRLGSLAERVVFLGGAVVPLLVTDPGAAPARPTLDVDVVVELTSRAEFARLRDELIARGFAEDTEPGAPICRWMHAELRLDVMPTDAAILGFGNRWYGEAVASRARHVLPGGPSIWLVSGPCFLATKLEAFRGRGRCDYRASHDLEDLIAVVDGRLAIEEEVARTDTTVRRFIAAELAGMLADPGFREALPGYLPSDAASQARVPRLTARIERLVEI